MKKKRKINSPERLRRPKQSPPPKRRRETPEQKAARREAEQRELLSWVIKDMAKRINAGYKKIEEKGYEKRSQSYITVEHYAVSDPNGKGKHFHIDYFKGTLRVSGDTRNMSIEEMQQYKEQLAQIIRHKTRTVSGVDRALKKAYKTAKERYKFEGNFEDYKKVWETHHDNVEADKKQKLDSETVMAILEYTDIYKMSKDDINAAYQYINTASDTDDALLKISEVQDALEIMENNSPEAAAEEFIEKGYDQFIDMFPNKFLALKEYIKKKV